MCLLLWTTALLMADEFVIRPADYLYLEKYGFQTAEGNWLVFFSAHGNSSETIYCHKISVTGVPLTTDAIPLAFKEEDQRLLNVVPTSDGNFVVVWVEIGDECHFYMQKVSPDGQSLWNSEGVALPSEIYYDYRVIANSIGGVTIAFQSGYGPIYGQNYDTNGSKTWAEAGLALTGMDDPVLHVDLLPYPGNGFLLHYRLLSGGGDVVMRFSETGQLVDDESFVPPNLFSDWTYEITGPVNGEYLVYKVIGENTEINKVGANGQATLNQNLTYNHPIGDIMLLSDGRVAYTSHYGRNSGRFLHMLSPDLVPLWNSGGNYSPHGHAKISELSGGKVMVTSGRRAQIFDASGVRSFPESKLITDDDNYVLFVLPSNDTGIFLWFIRQDTKQRIKLQALGIDGTLAHGSSGLILEERLNGTCDEAPEIGKESQCFTLDDKFIITWHDTRAGWENVGVYYQMFNRNMQPLLEPNGRTLQPLVDTELIQARLGNDDSLYLLYKTESQGTAYLQAIDYDRNRCFADGGVGFELKDQLMGIVGQVVYLAWTESISENSNKIMGQKYVNGQAQWNEAGELLLADVPNHLYTLQGFENGFLIFSDSLLAEAGSPTMLKALRFDSVGQVDFGGGSNYILLSSQPVRGFNPLIGAGAMGDDLCLVFSPDIPESPDNAVLQRISPQGHRLWGESGISFYESGRITNAIFKHDGLRFLALNNDAFNYHSVDTMGNFLTPEAGVNIIPASHYTNNVDLAAFEDGSTICVFDTFYNGAQSSDIYYRRIVADGTPTEGAPVVLCDERNDQSLPRIAIYSNTAFVTWYDQRVKANITGLWGKTVHSSTPADDALQTPIHQAQIIGNYPNPFNPSTTISFQIATDGMAKLDIYNIKGQLVKTLVKEHKARGEHQVVWDGKDFRGKGVASGVFFVRLSSAGRSSTHKMLLMQ